MPYTPAQLYQGQPGTTENSLTLRPFGTTSVPQNTKVIVKQIIMANTSTSAASVSVSFVRSGDAASNANRIVPNVTIDGNSMLVLDLHQVLEAGDFISAMQSTANAITLTISGVVVS